MIDEKKLLDELVETLERAAEDDESCTGIDTLLREAADAIESLSAKLEEPKWIPCSDRLPEEPEVSPPATLGALVREGTLQEYIVMPFGKWTKTKDRKEKSTMNEDIEGFLIEKKSLYQKRITRLEKQEHNIHGFLECEPGREDVIEDLNTVVKLQDRYNALIDFITELQESYF